MSTLGKCERCKKTVYVNDRPIRAGPPRAEVVFHGGCFKCSAPGCTWQLTLANYTWADGKAYCKNHDPMKGFSNPDHLKGTISADSVGISTAMSAPKLDTVNPQVRSTGGTHSAGLQDQVTAHALNAPKVGVVSNPQIRTTDTHHSGVLDQASVHALNAPKLDVQSSQQIRGAK